MSDNQSNNKRIAKNTLFLYIRMLLMMVVTLYTSRVVLATLGVVDFGIYNAVGGIVAMMGFLNSAMANAVQRFLSYEMGKGNKERVNLIFNISLQAHVIIAILVLVVMEIAGVWFLNNKLNVPIERTDAAMWVFQCSVAVSLFSIIQVPYNAIIIAKEQMNIYAYISIVEAVLKLAIVYLLLIWSIDKLVLYSILTMIVTIMVMSFYVAYCRIHYVESSIKMVRDTRSLKELVGFAGWNMLGEIAWIFTGQGVNLLLNVFFGPVVNAARGIAYQVESAVMRFVNSFQMALNPQIIKTYAASEHEQTMALVYRGTRFSAYLMLLLTFPLLFEMHYVLKLWLGDVPPHTVLFTQLVLVCSLVQSTTNLFATVAKAYGQIRNYQLVVSAILFLNFPLSYLALFLGMEPEITVMVAVNVQILAIVARLLLTKKMIVYSIKEFFSEAIVPVFYVSMLGCILPVFVVHFIRESFVRFSFNTVLMDIILLVFIYCIGLQKTEKEMIKRIILKVFRHGK